MKNHDLRLARARQAANDTAPEAIEEAVREKERARKEQNLWFHACMKRLAGQGLGSLEKAVCRTAVL